VTTRATYVSTFRPSGQTYATPVTGSADAKTLFLREVDSGMYKMDLTKNTLEFDLAKNPSERQIELLGDYMSGIGWAIPSFIGKSSDGRWTPFTATKFLRLRMNQGFQGVQVTVEKAEELINKDSGKKGDVSDPYVVVSISSSKDKFKTPVVKDNLNPVWNCSQMLPVGGDWHDQIIHFKVMDKDLIVDDPLGVAELPLRDALLDCIVSHFVLPLRQKNSTEQGKLTISLDGFNCGGEPHADVIKSADESLRQPDPFSEGTVLEETPK